MRNAKRGRGYNRGVYFCVAAALGLALSGCGGGGSGSSAATSQAAASAASAASAAPAAPAASGLSSSASATNSTPPTASTSVTINWTPPTENMDGTPLTNLAGYAIHYGSKSAEYTQTISVSNPGIATYVVDNLVPGTYYFSVSAVNSQGTQSPLSAEVSTTVN